MREIPQGELAPPWQAFLRDLDAALSGPVELDCLGGFVVALAYGAGRATSDIDVLSVRAAGTDNVEKLGGLGSVLHRRHLRLMVLDPIDLALTKVERNAEVDRRDVIALARAGWLDAAAFRVRYADEVAPYLLAHQARHDDTAESFARLIEASASDATARR